MFKDLALGCIPEAWRILREVSKGTELLPKEGENYQKDHVERWRDEALPGSASIDPSSTSAAPAMPRKSKPPPPRLCEDNSTLKWYGATLNRSATVTGPTVQVAGPASPHSLL